MEPAGPKIAKENQIITCEAASHWIILLSCRSPPNAPQPQFPVATPGVSSRAEDPGTWPILSLEFATEQPLFISPSE